MKIHIFGGSGSGKSSLAEKLAARYGVPHFDLDDLFWDNASGVYGKKADPAQRDAALAAIVRGESWVIEGVYCAWLAESFAAADRIVLLDVPLSVCRRRVVRRFLRRKRGREAGKRETLASLLALLRWMGQFQKCNLPQALAMLQPYRGKVAVLRSAEEADAWLAELPAR